MAEFAGTLPRSWRPATMLHGCWGRNSFDVILSRRRSVDCRWCSCLLVLRWVYNAVLMEAALPIALLVNTVRGRGTSRLVLCCENWWELTIEEFGDLCRMLDFYPIWTNKWLHCGSGFGFTSSISNEGFLVILDFGAKLVFKSSSRLVDCLRGPQVSVFTGWVSGIFFFGRLCVGALLTSGLYGTTTWVCHYCS